MSTVTRKTRVLCADDQEGVRMVLRLVIDAETDMQCVGCIASCDRLVDEVRGASADIVLLDATMPGKNPLAAMAELSAAFPQVKTIIYSGHSDKAFLDRVKNAGAWGFISKDDSPESLLSTLRKAALEAV